MRIKENTEGQPVAAEPAAMATQSLSPEPEAEDLFEMANLYPDTTGLPMTVWVSPRGNVQHDVRVKVNMTHGNQMNIANTAVVAVRPSPRIVRPTRSRLCPIGVSMGLPKHRCAG